MLKKKSQNELLIAKKTIKSSVKDSKNMAYVPNVINQILANNDASLAMLLICKKIFLTEPAKIPK